MSHGYVLTRWTCDQCGKRCETEGVHGMSLPDEHGWKRLTLHSGVYSTGRYGSVHAPSKPQERLACSLECAQALLSDRWRYVA